MEVSSTFRQFDQVLELGRFERGSAVLGRLRESMERYRAGTLPARARKRRNVKRVDNQTGASDRRHEPFNS